MSTGPAPGRVLVAWPVAAAAVALVVMVALEVLLHGAGTGSFADPYRALGRALAAGSTWRAVGLAAVGGLVVGTVHAAVLRRRG